jgi:hypothetical protein
VISVWEALLAALTVLAVAGGVVALAVDPVVFRWPLETWEYLRAAMCIGVFSLGAWLGVTL